MSKKKIKIKDREVRIIEQSGTDYICITDIAKAGKKGKGRAADFIRNYLKNPTNLQFLFIWEQLNNDDFKVDPAVHFRFKVTENNFILSVSQWVKETNASGLIVEKGKYGGTYAHEDIAYHFANWFDVEFYVYFIMKFREMAQLKNKSAQFYLNKIFDSTLEANQMTKFLLEGQKLIEEEE